MTPTPVPDAAVQIVADVLGFHAVVDDQMAGDVVAALADAGWLHHSAEVAALRAVVEAVRRMRAVDRGVPHYGPVMEVYAALDALPVTAGPAVPPGEDVERPSPPGVWDVARVHGIDPATYTPPIISATSTNVPAAAQGATQGEAVERLRDDVCDAARLVVYEDAPGHLARLVKAVWRLDGRKSPLLGDPSPDGPQPAGETEGER